MSDDKQDLRDAFEEVLNHERSVRLLREISKFGNQPIGHILIHDIFDSAIEKMGDKAVGNILRDMKREENDEPSP